MDKSTKLTPLSHRDELDGGSKYESNAKPAQNKAVSKSNLSLGGRHSDDGSKALSSIISSSLGADDKGLLVLEWAVNCRACPETSLGRHKGPEVDTVAGWKLVHVLSSNNRTNKNKKIPLIFITDGTIKFGGNFLML